MHLHDQNAGLLLTRVGPEIRFEALHLLAPDNVVMGCEGRLRRHFPARAVAVDRSTFLRPFLYAIYQLDAGATVGSFDDKPTDPKLVIDMIMGVLRGIGRDLTTDEVVSIGKHSREEAIKEVWPSSAESKVEFFWRRSALWLLLRVVLQLTLDRTAGKDSHNSGQPISLYKAFMVFLMASVLDKATRGHVPHEILFFMKAKINRRVLKLGLADTEVAWYSFHREVLRRVDTTLTKRDGMQFSRPRHRRCRSSISPILALTETLG